VKKTALSEYDTNRTGGIIAINLRDGDELVGALLVEDDSDLFLVSRRGMSIRFTASDEALRPMGRSTSGVIGMNFRDNDELLSVSVLPAAPETDAFVFIATEGGYAKRTAVEQYRLQNRGGLGIKVAKYNEDRGHLAGALIVSEDDEVLVVLATGKVVRSAVAEVPAKGRDTMGVVFARFADDDRIIALARNSDRNLVAVDAEAAEVLTVNEAAAPASEAEKEEEV
jgi:DNA gyrase subunit A